MNKEDLLYHYFSNSLTKAQEEEFQNLLKTDVKFREQFDYESNLKRAIVEKRRQDLKEKLNTFEASKSRKKSNNTINYLKIAASVVLLLSAGWFGYKSFSDFSYDDLYASNYETYPNTVFAITRSDTINSLERQAFVAYESKNYNDAITKFKALGAKNYLNFYMAQTYLGLDKNEEAKQLFLKIINDNQQFSVESHWYLALIYLKEKDKPNTIKYLNLLKNNHTFNKDKVIQLLDKLE